MYYKNILEKIHTTPVHKIESHTVDSKQDLIAFSQQLGPLLRWDFGYVNELKPQADASNYLYTKEHVPYHWDGAFHVSPYLLIFHCITASSGNGGETLFADTTKILKAIDKKTLQLLEQATLTYTTEKKAHYGGKITIKPLQTHPLTGEKTLRFAEPVNTQHNPVRLDILGISNTQAKQVTETLKEMLYNPEYYYAHSWNNNDILIVDNFRLLHARNHFSDNKRHIRRTQVLNPYTAERII
ncbi:MAG: TauD/TfdA family dioxygenase [Coxiellaceae bacterium]|nr:TauD/TfdA family dioxygenase [Coxiellaceae bacterium]